MTTKRCDHCKKEKVIAKFNWKFKALEIRKDVFVYFHTFYGEPETERHT